MVAGWFSKVAEVRTKPSFLAARLKQLTTAVIITPNEVDMLTSRTA